MLVAVFVVIVRDQAVAFGKNKVFVDEKERKGERGGERRGRKEKRGVREESFIAIHLNIINNGFICNNNCVICWIIVVDN